ncbi:hypothetical protein PV797_01925 [Clostridiaceae bacterium M8S5]|nr:hypothetical protein PV797_01925 [Clostridiaceae bacterium M8S5]
MKCHLETHSNGKHGFDLFNDDEETRTIIKNTLEFIQESFTI